MEAEAVRTARGSAYISIQSFITTLMGAIAFAIVARILTQTEMGIVVGLLLIMGFFQILSDLGFASGIAKYVAEYRGKNVDYTLITFAGMLIKVSLAGLFASVCALFASQLSSLLLKDTSYTYLFQLLAIDIFFICIFTTINKILLGLSKFLEMAILSVTAALIRQLAVIGLLILGYGLPGLITGWILGDTAYVIIGCTILFRKKHIKMHSPSEVTPHFKKIIKFSCPLFLTDTVFFLYSWFDRAILLAYIPIDEVAVYNVAYTAFGVLSITPTALSIALLPYFSEQYGKNKHDKIVAGANASTRYIIMVYTPLALGLMSISTPALALFAGEQYAEGGVILAILSLLGGIAGIGAALSVLLLVYNMTFNVLIINIISTSLGVALSLLLLPGVGSVGVAIVKGVVMIASFVLTVAIVKRRVSIKFDIEALWKSWTAAILMAIIVILMAHVFTERYFVQAYILIGGIVYLAAFRILKAANAGDIRFARNFLGKRADPIIDFLEKILLS